MTGGRPSAWHASSSCATGLWSRTSGRRPVLARYVWRDLVRNPRRSVAAITGIALGVGLFSAVLFFIDGSSASMTQRALAPLPIDMQRILTAPLGGRLHLRQTVDASGELPVGQRITVRLELRSEER